jgi:hypothetical protein
MIPIQMTLGLHMPNDRLDRVATLQFVLESRHPPSLAGNVQPPVAG